jgi:hypothetical protein
MRHFDDRNDAAKAPEGRLMKSFSWVRFSDYSFVPGPYQGGAIAPAPGATLIEYSPWEEYRLANATGYAKQRHDAGETAGDPAYWQLWRLGQKFTGWFDQFPELDSEQRTAILDFVRAHGLLGLFHHSMVQVVPSARANVWMRDGARWHMTPAKHALDVTCLQMPIGMTPQMAATPYADVKKQFFGSVPRDLPHPLSPEFFRYYRESTLQFLETALEFSRAVDGLQRGETAAMELLAGGHDRRLKPSPTAHQKDQPPFEEEPVYRSLLAGIADMAIRDIALGGFRLMACKECGNLLRTNFHRTLYCTEQCRWKAVQRAHRQKVEERAAKGAGKGAAKEGTKKK